MTTFSKTLGILGDSIVSYLVGRYFYNMYIYRKKVGNCVYLSFLEQLYI